MDVKRRKGRSIDRGKTTIGGVEKVKGLVGGQSYRFHESVCDSYFNLNYLNYFY